MIILVVLLLASTACLTRLLFPQKETKKKTTQYDGKWVFSDRLKPVLSSFRWEKAVPSRVRPFVGDTKHKMTMKLKNISKNPEEWILIENTYLERTKEKESILTEHKNETIHVDEKKLSVPALYEYYRLSLRFLVEKYPMYFSVMDDGSCQYVYNSIRREKMTLNPDLEEPRDLCEILARNMEEDFLILLKDNPMDNNEEYKLRCSSWCFPSGFSPTSKFDKTLTSIHSPVPSYDSKLKLSMNKFFSRLSPKDLWMRTNWAIQMTSGLMNMSSNHGTRNEQPKPLELSECDFNKSFLRCERQVVFTLPISQAKVMTIRTYTTPLSQVKEEGLGNDLVQAVDGLGPEFAHYKNRGKWGSAIKQYMTSA